MIKAYVLIETTVGAGSSIVRLLNALQDIKEVYRVTGPYDVIAVVEAVDLPALHGFLSDRLHPLPGVQKTVTCVVVA